MTEAQRAATRQPGNVRSAMFDAGGLIHQTHLGLKALRREWERELRQTRYGDTQDEEKRNPGDKSVRTKLAVVSDRSTR